MKVLKTFLLRVAFSLLVLVSAQAQVTFQAAPHSFEEMLGKAQETGKHIFIDAYTDWCGPCKLMDTEVFSTTFVGDYINERFVSYKFEVEKDSLGQQLAMKFGISGYPSFIVLHPNGKLRLVTLGYNDAEGWLKGFKDKMNAPEECFSGISTTLALEWPELYIKAFVPENGRRAFPDSTSLMAYLAEKNWYDEIPFRIAQRFQWLLPEAYQAKIIDNKERVTSLFGADAYYNFTLRYFEQKIQKAIKAAAYEKAMTHITDLETALPDSEGNARFYRIEVYLKQQDFNALTALLQAQIDDLHPREINHYSWELYLECEDMSVLNTAATWMSTVVKEHAEYPYYDTYAALLYKTKHYEKATSWARKAIALGKKQGEDTSETEALLDELLKK